MTLFSHLIGLDTSQIPPAMKRQAADLPQKRAAGTEPAKPVPPSFVHLNATGAPRVRADTEQPSKPKPHYENDTADEAARAVIDAAKRLSPSRINAEHR